MFGLILRRFMMPTHNKLVRDRIPEIIENTGKSFRLEVLDQMKFKKELKIKLEEEVREYIFTDTDIHAVEELADILEVIHALIEVHGHTIEEVETIRKEKVALRGSFHEKIFLIDVEDPIL
jgi:predicted house-cleaning noncanonical NTP pyrophosphatase (MazG superfamily)